MTNTEAVIKNRVLTLPKKLENDWQDAEVFIRGDADTLIVKKRGVAAPQPLSTLGKRLRKAGRNISVRDIAETIASIRRSRRGSRLRRSLYCLRQQTHHSPRAF